MNKKLFSYLASISFAFLAIWRVYSGFGYRFSLNDICLTLSFALFAFYNFTDNEKSRGLFMASTLYLLSSGLFVFNYHLNICDIIMLAGVIFTYVIYSRLYRSDNEFLHKYWYVPALLIFISLVLYHLMYNLTFTLSDTYKFLEPIGLFFMNLDTKEWY